MAQAADVIINDGGLTELNPGLDPTDVVADIVFIHGLSGHPRKTWTYKGPKSDTSLLQPGRESPAASETQSQASSLGETKDNVTDTNQSSAALKGSDGAYQKSFMRHLNPFKKSASVLGGEEKKRHISNSTIDQKPKKNANNIFFWPQNLPEPCKHARVLTFGYDADVSKFFGGAANKQTFYDHANDLLGALTRKRRDPLIGERPLVFVAHSLGGLIVKQMLINADRSEAFPERKRVYQATKALFFLGTPHRGSDYARWGEIVTGLASIIFDTNSAAIKHLEVNSEALMRLENDFDVLIYRRTLYVFTICEGKGFMPLPFLKTKIVDYNKLGDPGRERVFNINANHMDMCKYWGVTDPGYETIAGELSGVVQQIAAQAENELRKQEVVNKLNRGQKEIEILEQLDYNNRNFREDNITDAFVDTFWWLVPSETIDEECRRPRDTQPQRDAMRNFSQWISRSDESLFWISGKAGSGKSTLMKRLARGFDSELLLHTQIAGQICLVVSFWFSEKVNVPLLKSREGMLRSLLYQLLKRRPNSIPHVFPDLWEMDLTKYKHQWSCETLQTALTDFCKLNKSSKVIFLVDGLDEYDFHHYTDYNESDLSNVKQDDVDRAERKSKAHSEIGNFFKSLAKHRNTRVCVASRPRKFDSIFLGQPNICLEELTHTDIKTYVQGRFRAELPPVTWLSEGASGVTELQNQIVKNAAGVFLWVRLIVDILIDASGDFDTVEELHRKLNSLPTELGGPKGLYMRMLRDIKQEHQAQAFLFFDMVKTAIIPLQLLIMYFAELMSLTRIVNAPLERYSHLQAEQAYELMEGRLRSRCSGLLECAMITNNERSLKIRGPMHYLARMDVLDRAFEVKLWKGAAALVVNLEHNVQFIHFTFLEFLRQPYAQDFLRSMKSSEKSHTSSSIAITQGTLAALKFLAVPYHLVWDYIYVILHHAYYVEREDAGAPKIELLMDELDRVMTWNFDHESETTYPQTYHDLQYSAHWYMAEPQEQGGRDHTEITDITCVAVLSDLYSYVEKKLRLQKVSNLKRGRRSLLEYAVCPPINQTLWEYKYWFNEVGITQASPQIVQLLFDYGADPNEVREYRSEKISSGNPGGHTVWHQLLISGYLQYKLVQRSHVLGSRMRSTLRQSKERWYDIAVMFLARGADATCLIPGERYGDQSLHSTLFYAHKRLCPERDLQRKLYQALEKAGAAWLKDEQNYRCRNCSPKSGGLFRT